MQGGEAAKGDKSVNRARGACLSVLLLRGKISVA
jgi:hypothetical protein